MVVAPVLLLVAAFTAWFPAETRPLTAVVLAIVILACQPWGWARTRVMTAAAWRVPLGVLLAAVVAVTLAGWDLSAALSQLGLWAAVASLVWLASREPPREAYVLALAVALALLSLWAVWQVTYSFAEAQQQLHLVPEEHRAAFAARLSSGRAFASLPLPGHLAALLATALPLLVSRLLEGRTRALAAGGVVLCLAGLVLTRSVIGVALAVAAIAVLLWHSRRRAALVVLGLVVVTAVAVVSLRGDLDELAPVKLRLDNWKTAVWVWSRSPVCGVGLGGFGQASQAVPFAVGNQPMHAHCLPLELLADLGPFGLGLFVVAAWWLGRLVRRLWWIDPGLAVAVAVVPLHNLLDFSLHVSGVAIPWAVMAGWGAARAYGTTPAATQVRSHPMPLVLAGLAAMAVTLHASSRITEEVAARTFEVAQRAEVSARSSDLAPWRVSPVMLLASTAVESRDAELLDLATRRLERARRLRPHSASLALLEGRVALASGELGAAAAGVWAAASEQPRSEEFSQGWERLAEVLGSEGHGTPR